MKAPREITPQHLIECFEGHPHHRSTVLWLDSVSDPSRHDPQRPKPDFGSVTSFLMDAMEHTPPEYFELAARLVEGIRPCYATQAERVAYRALLACLRRGSHRRNLASLISLEHRRSRENVLQWMEQQGVRLTVDPAEVAE